MKCLKLSKKEYHEWQGGTMEYQFDVVGEPTIKKLCNDILKNKKEFGTIYIQEKLYHWCGKEYEIKYFCGNYVDNKNNKIKFRMPDELKDRKVRKVSAFGGYGQVDYYVDIEFMGVWMEL